MFAQALYLKNMTLDQFRHLICDRCIVTNVELKEGKALEMCQHCPLDHLDHLGMLGNISSEGKKDGK